MTELKEFVPEAFINLQITKIREVLKSDRAIIACSGGVDSTTCAVLTHRAVKENLVCVFIDTGFMRLDEPTNTLKVLSNSPLNQPIRLVNAKQKFFNALRGRTDAEEKRKAFRDTFYSVFRDEAKKESCQFLVQGTILPDILETVQGIKTQHNVLEQLKIDTRKVYGFSVVEPLKTLYKYQVREVAKLLGIPKTIVDRPPFPGPGLSVRVVGKITPEKLNTEKKATAILEMEFADLGSKQYFPAIFNDDKQQHHKGVEIKTTLSDLIGKGNLNVQTLESRATGIITGQRLYGKTVIIDLVDDKGTSLSQPMTVFDEIQRRIITIDLEVSRVLYKLSDEDRRGRWIIAIRAVDTRDFVTASVSHIPWSVLQKTSEKILRACPTVSAVYYDLTPKPPGSIEFE